MKSVSTFSTKLTRKLKNVIAAGLLIFLVLPLAGQTTTNMTIPAGSFIINMGVTPQTIANGLKPYGMVYALLQAKCPVHWVINPGKAKDGVDFTYNGVDYKGGPFIIEAKYRTSDINSIIATWQGSGVVGVTTTSPVTVPVYLTLNNVPRWTLDKQNGSIAVTFFTNAGIPAGAYGGSSNTNWDYPYQLNCCDDIFVMPHADPTWLTHSRLFSFNQECKGGIWLGCHAGSALEDMFDNINGTELYVPDKDAIDVNQQTNFLSTKSGPAIGTGPYSENALILWGNHDSGTLPYTHAYHDDPVMQFMGTIDIATQNGSEQIYIPVHNSAGWRPTTKVCVYDPDHPDAKDYLTGTPMSHVGAILAYGPGLGETTGRGKVMLEASHSVAKSTGPANVAGQRAFFNFSLLVGWEKAVIPQLTGLPAVVYSGQSYNLSYNEVPNIPPAPDHTYIVTWSSSCGGTFTPNPGASTTFVPPLATSPLACVVTVSIEDECGRTTFASENIVVQCNMSALATVTNPCFDQPNGGAITVSVTNGTGPFTYTWTSVEAGSGSGTLSSSPGTISGLQAGTYNVTVIANNGAGCPASFSVTLTQSPQINITATTVPVSCNGGSTGAINVSVTGGIPGYSYSWTGPGGFTSTVQNPSGLQAGTYDLTVLDSKGCSASTSVVLTEPSALLVTPTITNVTCFGENNGIINLAVTGGTTPYTFLWNDGNSSQNRTDLAPGTYSVTVTDGNNCTQTLGGMVVSQPAAALSLSQTHVNVLCYGASTGSADLTVTGGTTPYTSYVWTKTGTPGNYATTEDLDNLPAGTYNVTVTDSKGCTAVLSVEITQPPALALSTTKVDPTCPPDAQQNFADGSVNLTITGGAPGYTFSWTGPNGFTASTEDLSNRIAGTYTVVVTDSNSCTANTSVTLVYLNPNPAQPASIEH